MAETTLPRQPPEPEGELACGRLTLAVEPAIWVFSSTCACPPGRGLGGKEEVVRRAGGGEEIARRVLGIDARFLGVAMKPYCLLRQWQGFAAATRNCHWTRSIPVTVSVTGCST